MTTLADLHKVVMSVQVSVANALKLIKSLRAGEGVAGRPATDEEVASAVKKLEDAASALDAAIVEPPATTGVPPAPRARE